MTDGAKSHSHLPTELQRRIEFQVCEGYPDHIEFKFQYSLGVPVAWSCAAKRTSETLLVRLGYVRQQKTM